MLDIQQQQLIRQRTGWPDDIVRYIGSIEEAEVYMRANLVAQLIGDKWALSHRHKLGGLFHSS